MSHANSNQSSSNRERFAVAVECKKCGQHGSIFWEEDAHYHPADGAERALINISNGFHQEIGRTASGDPVIVCDNCSERLVE